METTTALLERVHPHATESIHDNAAIAGTDPPPGPLNPYASHMEELGRLIDEVAVIEGELAAGAAARAIAIDALRVCSERTDRGGSSYDRDMTRRSLIAELSCALRIPARTAANLLESSRGLVHTLPATLEALQCGEISYRHATILFDQTTGLPMEAARRLEGDMLPSAQRMTASQFERKTRMAREELDPASIVDRHERSMADRTVEFTPARDGMAWLSHYLPASDALEIYNRVTRQAMGLQAPDEGRTLTQLRADVLRDLLLDGPGDGTDNGGGNTPDLIVTVPMLTLLGMSDEPGNLDGYGPIDPDTARELASRCPSCIRILTHPETGAVLSIGNDRYSVPSALRRMLQVRDGTCRFPGCRRSARHSDLDHTKAWAHGGTTDHNNLAHLCPGDHAFKHGAGWKVAQAPDGSGLLMWTTPTGHQYLTEPETTIASAMVAEHRRPERESAPPDAGDPPF